MTTKNSKNPPIDTWEAIEGCERCILPSLCVQDALNRPRGVHHLRKVANAMAKDIQDFENALRHGKR